MTSTPVTPPGNRVPASSEIPTTISVWMVLTIDWYARVDTITAPRLTGTPGNSRRRESGMRTTASNS